MKMILFLMTITFAQMVLAQVKVGPTDPSICFVDLRQSCVAWGYDDFGDGAWRHVCQPDSAKVQWSCGVEVSVYNDHVMTHFFPCSGTSVEVTNFEELKKAEATAKAQIMAKQLKADGVCKSIIQRF